MVWMCRCAPSEIGPPGSAVAAAACYYLALRIFDGEEARTWRSLARYIFRASA
jgi:hypothetical protein